MIYGLCGASGSGKTTLGNLVAEAMDMTFVKTSITESARRHGYDAVAPLSLSDRLDLQYHLIDDLREMVRSCQKPAILDRTPIDMIAYMLCEVNMHSNRVLSQSEMLRIRNYATICMEFAREEFDCIFLLSPLEVYDVDPKRPPMNPAYMIHTQLVMQGALSMIGSRMNHALINTTDLNTRLSYLIDVIEKRLNVIDVKKKSRGVH